MSLDVSLYMEGEVGIGSGIFVREHGQTKEISRVEWDRRFPRREPFVVDLIDSSVYNGNITHNLTGMAKEADLYMYLWRPDESNITKAWQLVMPLRIGLKTLKSDPEKFKKLNPKNGWGTYGVLVEFVESYVEACGKFPDADIYVSR